MHNLFNTLQAKSFRLTLSPKLPYNLAQILITFYCGNNIMPDVCTYIMFP